MAPELKTHKRKASVPATETAVKKVKKTSVDTEGGKKRKAANEITIKPAKKSKAEVTIESSTLAPKAKLKSSSDKKQKSKDKATKKSIRKESIDESDEKIEDEASENSDDDEEVDDQTVALLAGFDSEEEDPEPTGKGFEAGGDVGKVDKKARKQALAAQKRATDSDEPGTIYLGHIPHGFYEHEIKSYFSQFGEITRYRVSRNPKTGRSKHYAFVEFKSSEVAEIVAKTMDNYLLFGHILKCKLLAPGQAHKDLWKGANKRFKTVPWNKIVSRKLNEGLDEAGWKRRNENEENRRKEKAEKTKAIGYEFEAPELKSAKDVPKTKREKPAAAIEAEANAIESAIEEEADAEIKAIEAAPVADTKENDKKSKKGKETLSNIIETVTSEKIEVVEETPKVESTKRKKKSKKAEKIVVVEEVKAVEEPVAEQLTKSSRIIEETLEESVVDTGIKEKPSTTLKSKKSKEGKAEKSTPTLKSKKSKDSVVEASPIGKAKKVKKQKSSSSLA